MNFSGNLTTTPLSWLLMLYNIAVPEIHSQKPLLESLVKSLQLQISSSCKFRFLTWVQEPTFTISFLVGRNGVCLTLAELHPRLYWTDDLVSSV